jgi:hypothetical protein
MSESRQQTIDPNLTVPLTLAAAEWDVILRALDEIPMPKRISAPLAAKIFAAVTEASQAVETVVEHLRGRDLPSSLRGDVGR